mmetsp:Transcript_21400/g.26333  ORF Transcript_21400/g.26333 Transcript_21400/m.26333 type:complete len:323 (-) Transcript_21400:276-1244(-)
MESNNKAMEKLIIVLLTSLVFVGVEVAGGYFANSIAIMSDAVHIASDVIGFGISICSLKIAQRSANKKFSYGYHRVEIVGAFCSIFSIWGPTIWLIYEATQRFFNPPEIGGTIMLSVAVLSLFFNLIQIKILHSGEGGHVHADGRQCSGHGHGNHHVHSIEPDHNHSHHHEHSHSHHEHSHSHDDHHHAHQHNHDHDHEHSHEAPARRNLNIDAAFLHILGDLLNSVGVIIAATIVFFWPDLWMVDPICTYLFAVIVLWTTRQTFWKCLMLILESTPDHIDPDQVVASLETIEGVRLVHDMHIWSLNNDKVCLTVHITLHAD